MLNFTPKLGGQFELEYGGQFTPELVVNLHWNWVVNLTGFSSSTTATMNATVNYNASYTDIMIYK